MDIIQKQNILLQQRERKPCIKLFVGCMTLLAVTVVGTSHAADYELDRDVARCTQHHQSDASNVTYTDCRPWGYDKTIKSEVIDRDGRRSFATINNSVIVECFRGKCLSVANSNQHIRTGEEYGTAPDGQYTILVNWYMGLDARGGAVSYRDGVGPEHQGGRFHNDADYTNEAGRTYPMCKTQLHASLAKKNTAVVNTYLDAPRGRFLIDQQCRQMANEVAKANVCVDNLIKQATAANPGAMIGHAAISEYRTKCHLHPEDGTL